MPYSISTETDRRIHKKTRVTWLKWRWALLWLFIIGYLLTNSMLGGGSSYLAATMGAIASCAILLTRLSRPLNVTLPFWTILAVFLVGYYVKFYWIVLDPGLLRTPGQTIGSGYTTASLLSAFTLATIAFASFCLTGWVFLGLSNKQHSHYCVETYGAVYRSAARFLIWTVPILMLLTFIVSYRTGILIMGVDNVHLPFRLAGIISYSRSVFIPGLILVLVFCGDKGGVTFHKKMGIALLLLHGLSDALLRSSRGQFIMFVLALGFYFLLRGKALKRSESAILIGSVLLTPLLFLIITEYRAYRIFFPNASIIEALTSSIQSISSSNDGFVAIPIGGLRLVFMRVTGIEMLLAYTNQGVLPLGMGALDVISSPRGVTGYVTRDLLRVPEYANTAFAVSLPGWFYLVGGTVFMAIGIIGYVALIKGIWNSLKRFRLRTLPAAQALVLMWVYFVTVEGTLDDQWFSLITMVASVMLCEWLVRRFEHLAQKR